MEALCCLRLDKSFKTYLALQELLVETNLGSNVISALDKAFFYLLNRELDVESKRFILRFIFYVLSKYSNNPLVMHCTSEEKELFEKIVKEPSFFHELMSKKVSVFSGELLPYM